MDSTKFKYSNFHIIISIIILKILINQNIKKVRNGQSVMCYYGNYCKGEDLIKEVSEIEEVPIDEIASELEK